MLLLGVNKKLEFLHVPYQGGGGGGQPPIPLKKYFFRQDVKNTQHALKKVVFFCFVP